MLNFLIAFLLGFSPSPSEQVTSAWGLALASVHSEAATPASVAPTPTPTLISAAKKTPINTVARKVVVPAPAVVTNPAPAPSSKATAAKTKGPVIGYINPNSFGGIPVVATQRLAAGDVVTKVQAFYKDTETLRAKFRQTVTNKTFGRKSFSDGFVWIKKPGKMRWDYYSKKMKSQVTKSFISDGATIWAVFHQDLQFFKQSTKDNLLPVAITFLAGQGDLSADFTSEIDTKSGYGAKGDYVVKLTPRKPNAQYKTLWLVVDPGNFRVKTSIVLNSKGDTNQFAFFEGTTKALVKDSFFIFDEKANKKFRLVNPEEAPKK